jgi:hypothetical protein
VCVDEDVIEWVANQPSGFNFSDFVNEACMERIATDDAEATLKEAAGLEAQAVQDEAASEASSAAAQEKKKRAEELKQIVTKKIELRRQRMESEQAQKEREFRLPDIANLLRLNKNDKAEVQRLAKVHSEDLKNKGFICSPEQLIKRAFPEGFS